MNNIDEVLQATKKLIGLRLNKDQAELILNGLDKLPDSDKSTVTYKSLRRDLESIVVIWDRRIKNAAIVTQNKQPQKPAQSMQPQLPLQKPVPVLKPLPPKT
jgi:hypothetical protein